MLTRSIGVISLIAKLIRKAYKIQRLMLYHLRTFAVYGNTTAKTGTYFF